MKKRITFIIIIIAGIIVTGFLLFELLGISLKNVNEEYYCMISVDTLECRIIKYQTLHPIIETYNGKQWHIKSLSHDTSGEPIALLLINSENREVIVRCEISPFCSVSKIKITSYSYTYARNWCDFMWMKEDTKIRHTFEQQFLDNLECFWFWNRPVHLLNIISSYE